MYCRVAIANVQALAAPRKRPLNCSQRPRDTQNAAIVSEYTWVENNMKYAQVIRPAEASTERNVTRPLA
jgi:hypothetical protein